MASDVLAALAQRGWLQQQSLGGSLSYAKSKVDSDFLSVGEQSGLLAGDGGFDIRVAGDTTLKGGVITSTEAALQAQNNWFETGGKLSMSDLHNHVEYDASSVSVSVGSSTSSSGTWAPSGSAWVSATTAARQTAIHAAAFREEVLCDGCSKAGGV